MDVISAGLIVADIIVSPLDRSVFDRDTIRIDPLRYCSGGDAFNVAINIKKMGLDSCVAGVIGNDMSGDFIKKTAFEFGINTEKLDVSEQISTATSIVLCEASGERHFAYNGMANDKFDGNGLDDTFLKRAKLIHIGSTMALKSLDGDRLTRLFKSAKRLGLMTSMDATSDSDNLWYEKIKGALPYTDIFIPSYDEALNITGKRDYRDITEFLIGCGVKTAGVKLGKDGCFIKSGGEECRLPAYKTDKVVDTTGAGDAFVSGFLTGVIRKMSLEDCARLGSANANFCIREFGAVANTKSFKETYAFMRNNQ